MNRLIRVARDWSPPVLWRLAHKTKTRGGVGTFLGPIPSWQEAQEKADGWESPEIAFRLLEASLLVRDGMLAFQEDGVRGEKIEYSPLILSFLLLTASRPVDNLSIIDFGGALGTHYFQHQKLLRHLGKSVKWSIVERPQIVELGRKHFSNPELQFFETIAEAVQEHAGVVAPSFLLSGSLQMVESYSAGSG